MLTDTIYYLYLVPLTFMYRFARGSARSLILGLGGVAFYYYYAGNALWLLLGLTVGSWLILFGAHDASSTRARVVRIGSAAVIVASVGVLVFFKYSGFFRSLFFQGPQPHVFAPLAISFFTFEFVHVAAERMRGNLEDVKFLDYFSFIFFFPTMVAGPIKRYQQFAPCLKGDPADATDYLEGLFRILLGLFKKLVVADNLDTIIQEIGGPSKTHNRILLVVAVFLYGFRILCDFAGYSDIAIGSARLFGIRVPENFLYPYRQRNIAMFWRHWHVSLSSWLVDYVYIPIGGSRGSVQRIAVNLIFVMLVSGLWHGAAWNFVLWGGWHGVMLATHRVYSKLVVPKLPAQLLSGRLAMAGSYGLTMVCVWVGWAFFMWPVEELRLLFGGHA